MTNHLLPSSRLRRSWRAALAAFAMVAAVASLALWTGVVAGGRLIAYV
ncbi:MAG TPA: hypothetical protein VFX49_08140 [Chloroflexota bacterium]|nr:hypothetical protein [Chloroflexota bacterium]